MIHRQFECKMVLLCIRGGSSLTQKEGGWLLEALSVQFYDNASKELLTRPSVF
ncbi:MAG: hypothetical protein ACI9LM_004196 [Alteromonadaceae bacterium]|jgi:hypothetical protein